MPSVAFYNQIVKPGMTKVEVSNKAQSDAVSDAVAALNLSLPNGQVVETKLADNAISLAPGEFGKLVLSAPNTRVSSVGCGSSFARGLVAFSSASISGVRFNCDADGPAVTILDGAKVLFIGCRFHRAVKGGEDSSSRHIFLRDGSAVFVACEFTGSLGESDKILHKGSPGGTANAIGCAFVSGAGVAEFDNNLGAI